MEIKSAIQKVGTVLQKNSPYILTGLGAAGVVTTAVLTGQATVKAVKLVEAREAEERAKDDAFIRYTNIERMKMCLKFYIPPVLLGASSIACIIGSQSINSKRHAALAGLYTLTESTFKDYRENVVKKLGEKKETEVRDEVAQKRLADNPASKNEIIMTGKGKMLCYDVYSGRYFKSDIETIRRIQNDLNHDLMGSMWVPLNDLYYAIGIPQIKLGDELGWTTDELIDMRFSSKLTDDGEPCLVIDYDLTPRYTKTRDWSGL